MDSYRRAHSVLWPLSGRALVGAIFLFTSALKQLLAGGL